MSASDQAIVHQLAVFARYHSHTKHCKACTGALRNVRRGLAALSLAIPAAAFAAALAAAAALAGGAAAAQVHGAACASLSGCSVLAGFTPHCLQLSAHTLCYVVGLMKRQRIRLKRHLDG